MTTTYRRTHPVQQPFMKDTFYCDYDVERGISKRVNCLVALTVVALIVGGAALGLSVMILLQGMDASARREVEVTTLQVRVKQLERQSGISNSTQGILGEAPANSDEVFPTIDEEPPQEEEKMVPMVNEELPQETGPIADEEASVNAGHPFHEQEEPEVEERPSEEAGGHREEGGGQGITYTVVWPGDDDRGPEFQSRPVSLDDDDEDGYGSGDCPILPRPVCPVDMTICYTKDVCPVPVCCRRL